MNRTAIARAMAELIHEGLLENSGLRRPDKTGRMQVVWQTSAFGHMVSEYQQRLGLTFEQALAKAKADAANETLSPTRATDVPGGDPTLMKTVINETPMARPSRGRDTSSGGMTPKLCPICGRAVPPAASGRPRLYCSDVCGEWQKAKTRPARRARRRPEWANGLFK